jgi:hypothetical protein
MERYKVFVLISVILIFPKFVFSQLTVTDVTVTNNKNCGCNYKGPKVVINEIMIKPAAYNVDGSIYDVISRLPAGGYSERGEWLELYNPDYPIVFWEMIFIMLVIKALVSNFQVAHSFRHRDLF